METIKLYKPTEEILVDISGQEVKLTIALEPGKVKEMVEYYQDAGSRLAQLDALEQKAKEQGDEKAIASIQEKAGKELVGMLSVIVGKKPMTEVLKACGGKPTVGVQAYVLRPLATMLMEMIYERTAIAREATEKISTIREGQATAAQGNGDGDALPADAD